MELVRTGVDNAVGSLFTDRVDVPAETGADPVCVCVGGFCRYGMKDITLCSATAGEMLAHH
jgi:hypothetical protein